MFNVLALSGGGYRGLYTISVIEEFQRKSHGKFIEKFDLLCGTSIGGIIALALSAGKSPAEIKKFFLERGQDIFSPRFPYNLMTEKIRDLAFRMPGAGMFFGTRYSAASLKKALDDLFGNLEMKDLKIPVIIPTINFTKGSGQFYKAKTNRSLIHDAHKKVVDVALATSAAPLFFPMHNMENGVHVDGGLFGNSPGLFGVHEAVHFMKAKEKNICLLSIGSLSSKYTVSKGANLNRGLFSWGANLMKLSIAAQEISFDFLLQHKLGKRYLRIDEILTEELSRDIGLDRASESSRASLLQLAELSTQKFTGNKFFKKKLNIKFSSGGKNA
jgi:patatin-like phospholipase/acyl hydrolase